MPEWVEEANLKSDEVYGFLMKQKKEEFEKEKAIENPDSPPENPDP